MDYVFAMKKRNIWRLNDFKFLYCLLFPVKHFISKWCHFTVSDDNPTQRRTEKKDDI